MTHTSQSLLALAASAAYVAAAPSLESVCTPAYMRDALPADDFYDGITLDTTSVTASPVTNVSVMNSVDYPDSEFDYCNVSFTYTHNGRNDQVYLALWLLSPDNFQSRYLSTGGGGYAINSGSSTLPSGIINGAVSGETDGGFGGLSVSFNDVTLLANGTVDWQNVFMFGYQAQHELATLSKQLTRQFYNMIDSTKLYSYYQGCSEGGREGWSQIQRYENEFDGVITGAPALRWAHQQVQHLYSNLVEQTLDYYPPPCELTKIMNETITACDPLDGKTDGVIARSDLCQLQFNLSSIVGKSYSCAASSSMGGAPGGGSSSSSSSTTPAQNGTVSAKRRGSRQADH